MGEGNVGEISAWCRIKTWVTNSEVPNSDPKELLEEINKNEIFKKIERGETNLLSNYKEGLSTKGAKALKLVQEALIALDLLNVSEQKRKDPNCWWAGVEWGLYGDQTIAAVRKLQETAGIDYYPNNYGYEYENGKMVPVMVGRVDADGQRFGAETLVALKEALQAKAEGKNWREAIRPK